MEQEQAVVEESAAVRWARIIEQQRSSGLAVSAFCRERSVSVASYYAWRRKLAGGRATAGFAHVEVVEDRNGADQALSCNAVDMNPGAVRIELTGGRRVVVSRGFDRRLLLEVIGVLEEIAAGASF